MTTALLPLEVLNISRDVRFAAVFSSSESSHAKWHFACHVPGAEGAPSLRSTPVVDHVWGRGICCPSRFEEAEKKRQAEAAAKRPEISPYMSHVSKFGNLYEKEHKAAMALALPSEKALGTRAIHIKA